MSLPVIFKEAFSTAQLRAIKRIVPLTRNPGETPMVVFSSLGTPKYINIPRNYREPIDALVHEFGHVIDMARGGIIKVDKSIIEELRANRQGARFLMHTGSRPSEVKRFARNMSPHVKTYIVESDLNILDKTLNSKEQLLSLPLTIKDKLRKMPAEGIDPLNVKHQALIRDVTEDVAKDSNINMDIISPFSRASTALDISKDKMRLGHRKGQERRTFNNFLKNNRKIKRVIGTPEIIHLGDKG